MNSTFLPSSSGPRAPIIFVLDDDEAVRDSIRILLEAEGYIARMFDSVARFLEGFSQSRCLPDCVILDIHLPDGNGLAVGALIIAEKPSLPVILMSGHENGRLDAAVAMDGVFAFLGKPLNHDNLFDVIARAVAR